MRYTFDVQDDAVGVNDVTGLLSSIEINLRRNEGPAL